MFGVLKMKALWRRYLNEIVGLTVMALMTVALIAGQAKATGYEDVSAGTQPAIEIRLTLAN
jgi:hypothetical protein